MKILMVTPYVPYPLMSGGQIRTWNLVKRLSSQHEFTLVCFYREEKEKEYQDELKKIFSEVYFVKKDKPWTPMSLIKSLGKYPLLMNLYDQKEAKKIIKELVKKETWDIIHCEPFYIMQNLPPQIDAPVVLVEHNIEYLAYKRFADKENFLPLKKIMGSDVEKIEKWEKYFWHQAKTVITVSDEDQKVVGTLGISKVELVPNGVDLDHFTYSPKLENGEKTILFVGDFKWFPNLEAVKILKNKIWPKIKSMNTTGKIKLWIVGKYIPDNIKSWNNDEIKISEELPDIREAYTKSDLLLAPIYSGSGTRYKILEAMASGCIVVTSPLGAEGLNIEDGKNAVIGKTPEELATKTIEILKDGSKRKEIAQNARSIIEKYYSWDKISQKLNKIYESIASVL